MTLNPLKLSPFQRVIASLFLGIALGIFVGEPAGKLEILGNIYIKLLQMTVIPYILVSLIGGLGRLDMAMAKQIGIKAGLLILFIWTLTMLSLLLLPLAYPNWTSASFFSTSLIHQSPPVDLLRLYIPSNPFYSLANTLVPAIVLFSLFLGLAMISVKDKENFLQSLQNLSDALMKIASVVAKTAPVGIFALSASAAGTLDIAAFSRLQVYLWAYLVLWLVFVAFTLPALVAMATPLSYSEVLRESRLAMITAFATGTVLVVLPMIAERTKKLIAQHKMDDAATRSTVDVLVPTAYSFPSVGTLMGIGFIMFAAWFNGSPLSPGQYPAYTIMGALSAFGSMAVAIPFMLDFFKLPSDLFQLYLLGSVFTMRFATAMAALHGVAISLLGASAIVNRLKWQRLFQVGASSLAISALLLFATGQLLTHSIPYRYTGYQQLIDLDLTGKQVVARQTGKLHPLMEAERQRSRLDVIRQRGTLRVGYFNNRLPYAFRNRKGKVVGYDMALIHALASDLDVSLEIIKIDWNTVQTALADGSVDIVIGGISISVQRALLFDFSRSYMDETLGLIVPDEYRNRFASYQDILQMPKLKLAATRFRYREGSGQIAYPNAEIVEISNTRDFLKNKPEGFDGLLYTAEAASAWTLIYPDWSVVVPKGLDIKSPVAFALPKKQPEWRNFIDTWLRYQTSAGLTRRAYNYWILGKAKQNKKPRWSIMRDVLGWKISQPPAKKTDNKGE